MPRTLKIILAAATLAASLAFIGPAKAQGVSVAERSGLLCVATTTGVNGCWNRDALKTLCARGDFAKPINPTDIPECWAIASAVAVYLGSLPPGHPHRVCGWDGEPLPPQLVVYVTNHAVTFWRQIFAWGADMPPLTIVASINQPHSAFGCK